MRKPRLAVAIFATAAAARSGAIHGKSCGLGSAAVEVRDASLSRPGNTTLSLRPHVHAFVYALVAKQEVASYGVAVLEEELNYDVAEVMIREVVILVDESRTEARIITTAKPAPGGQVSPVV
jgi:hypothetical protein